MNRRLLLIALLATAACGRSDSEFVIGIYGVDNMNTVRELKEAGVNAVQALSYEPDRLSAFVKASHRIGVRHLLPAWLIGDLPASAYPGAIVYLFDEPDGHGVSSKTLRDIERRINTWAPHYKTAFVVAEGLRGKDYPDIADILMVDNYPVPFKPLESFGHHVREAFAYRGNREVWAVVQAMDWKNFFDESRRGKFRTRYPTLAEMRFMSYDAILSGAAGLWYFTYRADDGTTLSQHPRVFEDVKTVVREMRAMAPILSRGTQIELPFPVPMGNWAARCWRYRGRRYLVIVNRDGKSVWEMPKSILEKEWRVLFDKRRDPKERLTAALGTHFLEPHGVVVLESRLRLRDLIRR